MADIAINRLRRQQLSTTSMLEIGFWLSSGDGGGGGPTTAEYAAQFYMSFHPGTLHCEWAYNTKHGAKAWMVPWSCFASHQP